MSAGRRNPSMFDRVRDELRRSPNDLGPLLRPERLQLRPVHARPCRPARKR
ncbi:MAG: hypothetical protein RMK99_11870 [Anaerolineales bacterium]|nr:hypothetical protein [Anaerolineales bacterium]